MSKNEGVITGEVLVIGETEVINENFSKRIMVIEVGDKYPKPIAVEFTGGMMDRLDGVRVGAGVEVEFFVSGYQGKKDPTYFGVNLRAKNFAFLSGANTETPVPQAEAVSEGEVNAAEEAENDDNLPF